MQLLDYFAPTTWHADNATDADLGSTPPALLPNGLVVPGGQVSHRLRAPPVAPRAASAARSPSTTGLLRQRPRRRLRRPQRHALRARAATGSAPSRPTASPPGGDVADDERRPRLADRGRRPGLVDRRRAPCTPSTRPTGATGPAVRHRLEPVVALPVAGRGRRPGRRPVGEPAPRLHRPGRAARAAGPGTADAGLLAGRPPTAASSPSAPPRFCGSAGCAAPGPADRRHGRHPRPPGLLAGGLRRRGLRLRRRRLLRLDRRPPPEPAHRRHGADPGRSAATGWSPPTAASSPSATPASPAPPAGCTSTRRWSGSPPAPTTTATGWSPPTAGSSPSARRRSPARPAVST